MTAVRINVGGDEIAIEASGAKAEALIDLAIRALRETTDHPRRLGSPLGFHTEIAPTNVIGGEVRAGKKR